MNFFSNSLVYFIKKPLIPIYVACISLAGAILMIFNPFKQVTAFVTKFISDDLGTTVIMLSKSVYTLEYIPYLLLGILGVSVALALLSSLLFSGYMNVIHLTVKRVKTDVSHYIGGIKKGFFRSSLVFFQIYVCALLFISFIPLALTPYYILQDSVIESGNDPLILYLLLAVIIIVFISIIMLIYMNFMFRFPSIFHFSRYPIEKSAASVNAGYWRTFAKVFILIAFYAGIQFIMYQINNKVLEFLAGFVLNTVYFSFFAVFPFYIFDRLIEPYRIGG